MRKRATETPAVVETAVIRPVEFVGTSREDLKAMPRRVTRAFGLALSRAQRGEKAGSAKPLKGYRGAGVLEVVEDYDSDTYRLVYTVRCARAVYVLHAFQKKSPRGIKTAAQDLALIDRRLRAAERDYALRYLLEEDRG